IHPVQPVPMPLAGRCPCRRRRSLPIVLERPRLHRPADQLHCELRLTARLRRLLALWSVLTACQPAFDLERPNPQFVVSDSVSFAMAPFHVSASLFDAPAFSALACFWRCTRSACVEKNGSDLPMNCRKSVNSWSTMNFS